MQKFNRDFINKVASAVESEVIDKMDKIALQSITRLVIATPVDLGQARAGWNFSLNVPNKELPKSTGTGVGRSGKKGPIYGDPDEGYEAAASKIGDSYFITNSVQHVIYLNEGSSAQAGSNFIDIEVTKAIKDVG